MPHSTVKLEDRLSEQRTLFSLSLFWRTFLLSVLLLLAGVLIWFETLRRLEKEPRLTQTVQQITTAFNLTKAALLYSDKHLSHELRENLARTESIRIKPRKVTDQSIALKDTVLRRRIEQSLQQRADEFDIGVAENVNGKAALWISFTLKNQPYWLCLEGNRSGLLSDDEWVLWQLLAAVTSLFVAGVFAWYLNRPYQQLFAATNRFQMGDFRARPLDEKFRTHEIKEVSRGFNRMATRLTQIDEERSRMLAGLSHDLRTPLARLRLDTELSVSDAETRAYMAADIEQLDDMIDKFLDYAQPSTKQLVDVNVFETITHLVKRTEHANKVVFELELEQDLWVEADPTELTRVLSNLIENAMRYGKTVGEDFARVRVTAYSTRELVIVKVRDYGVGANPDEIPTMAMPFFRGDSARTEAKGTGLGLSVVQKIIFAIGGKLHLGNHKTGGFVARIELRNTQHSV
jgi:two-component system, OmpR family, osmolarity sensor histidine kinase EnvZ